MNYYILAKVGKYGSVSRTELHKQVKTDMGDVSERAIDKWLQTLLSEGYLLKKKVGRSLNYQLVNETDFTGRSKDEILQILNENNRFLPNQTAINSLIHKLEIDRLPPLSRNAPYITRIINELYEARTHKTALRMMTSKGVKITVNPLYLYYHSTSDQWYLKYCRNSVRAKSIHSLRLTQKTRVIDLPKRRLTDAHWNTMYDKAHAMDQMAFEGNYEAPVKVKVLFDRVPFVLDKARYKLEAYGEFADLDDESVIFSGIIYGATGFYKWLRGFGSSVLILEPSKIAHDEIESLKKIIGYYDEETGCI